MLRSLSSRAGIAFGWSQDEEEEPGPALGVVLVIYVHPLFGVCASGRWG